MATTDDTRAGEAQPLPSRQVLEQRIADIRRRLWAVQGTCAITSRAGAAEDGGAEGFATDVWNSMDGAARELDEIAGALDPTVILRRAEEVPQ